MSDSYTGKLLVASPSVADPLFGRGVCLVMHHDEDGAIGVLLNRPMQGGPEALWKLLAPPQEQASEGQGPRWPQPSEPENRRSIHFGGPVSGPVMALHSDRELAEAETGVGVYVAAQKEHLQQLVKPGLSGPMRLIVGHAAWQSGQLEAEIKAGFWYLLPATADRVFEADDSMWAHLVRTGLGHSLAAWVGIDDTHINPCLN
ncbi:YqgE/AlgH family protein [Planctomycetaceae bacterium SH139]